jgi:holin-like protein
MRYIKQLAIILAFALAGEFFVRFVPGGFQASVMGMLFMLAALRLKLLKPEHINECADFLSNIMALFFIPASVTIIQNYEIILPILWQILFIGIVCTFFTFFICYGTARLLRVLLKRKN